MKEFWTGESAEKEFQIDRESGYFNAQKFASNPIEYLEGFKVAVLDEGCEEDELGIRAIEHIRELCHIMENESIPVANETVHALATAQDMSPEWARSAFAILKEAGYTKTCVKTWLLLDEPFATAHDEINEGRQLNTQLDEIYGID